jgi:hypothetical protein
MVEQMHCVFFQPWESAQDKSNHFASGGGSGGQILIFSGPSLKAPDDQLPTLKASGTSEEKQQLKLISQV